MLKGQKLNLLPKYQSHLQSHVQGTFFSLSLINISFSSQIADYLIIAQCMPENEINLSCNVEEVTVSNL